jgi:Domain of unknown function (DUF5664)
MLNEHDLKDMLPEGGLKYDDDKPPMSLLDAEYLEGIANVLGFGAKKYAAHNWRKGINTSRLISSLYRHLGAINKGEDVDPESGLPHVYHLGCNTMFLASMLQHYPNLDDRFKND